MTENQQIMIEEYNYLKSVHPEGVKYDALIRALVVNHGWNGMRVGAVTSGLQNAGFLMLRGVCVEIDVSPERREAVLLARKNEDGRKYERNSKDTKEVKEEGKGNVPEPEYVEHIVNRPWGSSKQLRGCLDCKFYAEDEKNKKSQCYDCKKDITGAFGNWIWKLEEFIVEIIQDPNHKEYPQYDKIRLNIPKGEKS